MVENNKYSADIEKNKTLGILSSRHSIVKAIVHHHSSKPFKKIGLTCKESPEARKFYLDLLRAIGFTTFLPDLIKEIITMGEAIITFEGSWGPPKFLDPSNVVISLYEGQEEHVEYYVDPEIKTMVWQTPENEKKNLLKTLDAYSIRQIEMDRPIDLSRSPNIKVMHPRRITSTNPTAPRGVSYFEPILNKLIETETLKEKIISGQMQDYPNAIKKIRDTDKLLFDYAFPKNTANLENELKYLQDIVKFMLREQIFTPAAMARNFVNSSGLILPVLEFDNIDLKNDVEYKMEIANLRAELGIDTPISAEAYAQKIRAELTR